MVTYGLSVDDIAAAALDWEEQGQDAPTEGELRALRRLLPID